MAVEKYLAPTALENSILDRTNPASLVNMAPKTLSDAIRDCPPSLLMLSEQELKGELRELGQEPTLAVHRLRIAFWNEYSTAQAEKRKMSMHQIYGKVCGESTWFKIMRHLPGHLAWILCPPPEYVNAAEAALLLGIDQLHDILSQPHLDKLGGLDAKKASVKVEIVKFLDQRVKGAVVQKTQNLHAHLNAKGSQVPEAPRSLEEVERRMRELEEQALLLSTPQGEQAAAQDAAIDAEFTPVVPKI